ncbi:hypothetical protein JCM4914_41500 [Streptomyces platensis subsp. malvinus]
MAEPAGPAPTTITSAVCSERTVGSEPTLCFAPTAVTDSVAGTDPVADPVAGSDVAGSDTDSDSGAGSDADSVTAVSPGSRYLDIWVPTGTGHVQSMGALVISA